MKTIGIVGAGTIGTGVAQSVATAGFRTLLVDTNTSALSAALIQIRNDIRLSRLIGGRAVDPDEVLQHIQVSDNIQHLEQADLVVENITEEWDSKASLYRQLDLICGSGAVFAANTSVISITRLASLTKRQDQVVGIHFMNPVPLKSTVEMIRGLHTSESTISTAREFLEQLGKRSVLVHDYPGFVSNRVLMLMINEAVGVLHDQVATADQIDQIFVECMGHKMGPLETADLIGLDTILLSIEGLCESFTDSKYRAHPILRKMVDAGYLGKKSGRGFYDYGLD